MTALATWAATLAFLDAEPAAALEGIILRLDLVMGEDRHRPVGDGEADGFSGIAHRGDLDRLLLSEWLIADEEPLEFLRRLSTGEASYLERERRRPEAAERMLVLLDAGPDQAGGPRLVQLAALVVLAARADARGIPLDVGYLPGDPGAPVRGDLADLFEAWLRARDVLRPTAGNLAAWLGTLERDDHAWILGADRAVADLGAASLPGRVRRLTARESAWSADRATEVEVTVEGRVVTIPLPGGRGGIRLLRGEGIRRGRPQLASVEGTLRFPRFPGAMARLVCRTERADELLVIPFSDRRSQGDSGRARRRPFQGAVLAISMSRKRTVALVRTGDHVRVVVEGVGLPSLGSLTLPIGALDIPRAELDELPSNGLWPLLVADDHVLVRLGSALRRISWSGQVRNEEGVVAAAPLQGTGYVAARLVNGLVQAPRIAPVDPGMDVILGQAETVAVGTDLHWRVTAPSGASLEVTLEPGETVLGAGWTGDTGPMLIARSPGERLIRVHAKRPRTLTAASGNVIDVALHPTLPYLAVQRTSGSIHVFSLRTGEPVLDVGPQP